MFKTYVKISAKGVILSAYASATEQRIDKVIETNIPLLDLIGMKYNSKNSVSVNKLSLIEKKEMLIFRINTKAEAVYTYLEQKYRVSKKFGTLDKLSKERFEFKKNSDEYYSLTDEEKSLYLKEMYPAIFRYMNSKNRTLEVQLAKIEEKEDLSFAVSAKTESLISAINVIETEDGLQTIDDAFKVIEEMESVSDFMTAMSR